MEELKLHQKSESEERNAFAFFLPTFKTNEAERFFVLD
jgi:hypothetical protein